MPQSEDRVEDHSPRNHESSPGDEDDTSSRLAPRRGTKRPPPTDCYLNTTALRLGAIFYPKFENLNESLNIRAEMLKTNGASAYLEVSVKHSGSLVLWSGGDYVYSKNSADNVFTVATQLLLRQQLSLYYHEISAHLLQHRLTCAFEVVTAVLGDHGQRPKHDYILLTAVADCKTAHFFSTRQLVEFAQRFRLPHNDVYVFCGNGQQQRFFEMYDAHWETATAETLLPLLKEAADIYLPSPYEYVTVQGSLLEGVVVRQVVEDAGKELEALRTLQQTAFQLQPPSCNILREFDCKSADYEDNLRKMLANARGNGQKERSTRMERVHRERDVNSLLDLESLLTSSDGETRQIASLLQQVRSLNLAVDLNIFSHDGGGRSFCIVHVLHDKSFKKYQAQRLTSCDHLLPLFRGFVIELLKEPVSPNELVTDMESSSSSSLMLKMKCLPYMIRTFACRNGLHLLKTGSTIAFCKYTSDLLTKWKVGTSMRQYYSNFFRQWAMYMKDKVKTDSNVEYSYLDHLETFESLFRQGKLSNTTSTPSSSSPSFRGAVVVLAVDSETANQASDWLAQDLGANRIDVSSAHFTADQVLMYGGAVCSAVITNGVKGMRALSKEFGDRMSLVIVGCSDAEMKVKTSAMESKVAKMTTGMLMAWRKSRWGCIVDIDDASDDASRQAAVTKLLDFAGSLSEADMRFGCLVFFPAAIPGCGKSSMLGGETENVVSDQLSAFDADQPRTLIIRTGDQINQPYWPLVQKERSLNGSSVYIADKNVPYTTWDYIGSVAAKTRSIAVPVIPSGSVLKTTTIQGMRHSDGTIKDFLSHNYPFSLKYLAVCIARVLQRPQDTHEGKLDSGTARACMIVVKFFSLYRHVTAEGFHDELRGSITGAGAVCTTKMIEVPFFPSDAFENLPEEVEDVLREALQSQYGFEDENLDTSKVSSDYLDDLEKRIRVIVAKHPISTASLNQSQKAFSTQLLECVAEADAMQEYVADPTMFCKIASIDVPMETIHEILRPLVEDDRLVPFFERLRLADVPLSTTVLHTPHVVAKTHVTLAHFRQMSQSKLRETFEPLVGSTVNVKALALLWSERVAALQVETDCAVQPLNEWPHITVWYAEGASAAEANQLPKWLQEGKAKSFEFATPVALTGTVTLWTRET